jgi:F0F1-type ATP synthase assembly protein I
MQVFALASTISVQFAASVVLGWWGGHFFDRRLNLETPWLGVLGLLLGIGAGIYGIVGIMARFSWKNGNNEEEPKDKI